MRGVKVKLLRKILGQNLKKIPPRHVQRVWKHLKRAYNRIPWNKRHDVWKELEGVKS